MQRGSEARKAVLDASALLAVVQSESGAAMVEEVLDKACMSAVNLMEVLERCDPAAWSLLLEQWRLLGLQIVPFEAHDAEFAAKLKPHTKAAGLSLGDRACLALAARVGVPAITADNAWSRVKLQGVTVRQIR